MEAEQPAPLSNPISLPQTELLAPLWHTVVLVVGIVLISMSGSGRIAASGSDDPRRVLHYALSGLLELAMVGFVFLGLRLRKTPVRILFANFPKNANNVVKEAGVALVFWFLSMLVLASTALTWNAFQTTLHRRHAPGAPSSPGTNLAAPDPQQIDMVKKLMTLAPANGAEIVAWASLCLVVGFSEELVFRGYLQRQVTLLSRSTALGVGLPALAFGAAHEYQGFRGMCLIAIYGGLFGGIALVRRNLFPGMLAHAWHDFATGMALALIRETGILEHIPHHL